MQRLLGCARSRLVASRHSGTRSSGTSTLGDSDTTLALGVPSTTLTATLRWHCTYDPVLTVVAGGAWASAGGGDVPVDGRRLRARHAGVGAAGGTVRVAN